LPISERSIWKICPWIKIDSYVGTTISPGNPTTKDDGTVVRTLWGEIAWQLGGKEGYEMIRADDENATNPGDKLKDLFNRFAPCLILIDEWVAYARQLHEGSDLPAGTFVTQFTFAQTLSESAKAAQDTLLVVSIPASDNEIGGEWGQQALARLKNAIGRVEASWRPASPDDGFEIVRRRLFEPITDKERFVARDASRIADEVIQHLTKLVGANVQVTLEIQAELPDGATEKTIRDVTENCRTLRFDTFGFEEA